MEQIYLATEDEISEAIGEKLIKEYAPNVSHVNLLRRGGNGYLLSNTRSFCELARSFPVVIITDLDMRPCAPAFKDEYFRRDAKPPGFIFRVAVREIETWLLADSESISTLLKIARSKIPRRPEELAQPKEKLISLAREGRNNEVKRNIVPEKRSAASQGIGYNFEMRLFIGGAWNPERARQKSDSLDRAILDITKNLGQAVQ